MVLIGQIPGWMTDKTKKASTDPELALAVTCQSRMGSIDMDRNEPGTKLHQRRPAM